MKFLHFLIVLLLALLLVMDGKSAFKEFSENKKIATFIFRLILLFALFFMTINFIFWIVAKEIELPFILLGI